MGTGAGIGTGAGSGTGTGTVDVMGVGVGVGVGSGRVEGQVEIRKLSIKAPLISNVGSQYSSSFVVVKFATK
jgi:hypothetical protein